MNPKNMKVNAILVAIAGLIWSLVGASAPTCWEDEVVVIVVHDEYDDLEGQVHCVPADDMTAGFRPEED